MLYVEHAPAADLRAWVDRYWSLEDATPETCPQPVLPDGHPEWVIHFGEPFATQGTCLAIGQMTTAVTLRATGPIRVFGVRFRPEGAYAFTRCDQSGLTNRILDLTAIAPHWREQAGNGDPVAATDEFLRTLNPTSTIIVQVEPSISCWAGARWTQPLARATGHPASSNGSH